MIGVQGQAMLRDRAKVRVDSWRTTYRGMIADAYLDGMQVELAPPSGTSC